MAEYITKEAALEAIMSAYGDVAEAEDNIRAIPAVDFGKSKQASWVTDSDGIFVCSECEEPAPQRMMFHPKPFYWTCEVKLTNYCPNCGCELWHNYLTEKTDD